MFYFFLFGNRVKFSKYLKNTEVSKLKFYWLYYTHLLSDFGILYLKMFVLINANSLIFLICILGYFDPKVGKNLMSTFYPLVWWLF